MGKKKKQDSINKESENLSEYDILFNKLSKENKITFNKIFKFLKNNDLNFLKIYFIFIKNINLLKNSFTKFSNYIHNNIYIDYYHFLIFLKDKKCIPFWNNNIKNISNEIFLPLKDNLIKIENNTFKDSNEWLKTEHFISKNEEKEIIINKERLTLNEKIKKTKKIKMLLNPIQKKVFKKIIGIYRYFYNRAIDYINNYNKETKTTYFKIDNKNENTRIVLDLNNNNNDIFSMNTMRELLKNINNDPDWFDIKIHSHLKDLAFKEASKNFKISMSKYKKYHFIFQLKHKSKKDIYQTIQIEKLMFNNKRTTLFTNLKYEDKKVFEKIKFSESFKNLDICDSSISYNIKLNEFYLNLNYNFKIENQELKNKKVVSCDPGIRTFLTCYSDNKIDQIGINFNNKLNKICKEIDIIKQRINIKNKNNNKKYEYKKRTRRNMKKALHRKIKYLKNIKEEIHNKSIKYLTENNGKIIIPPFDTQEMSMKFNSKIARNLYNISFFTFKEKLNLYSDFIPKLISYDEKSEELITEKINNLCVSDMHGENFSNVPPELIKKIRNIVKILYEDGFNYPDITGYNFIEDDNGKAWLIDFEHCFCKGSYKILTKLEKSHIKFIEDFVYNNISTWNPDFR